MVSTSPHFLLSDENFHIPGAERLRQTFDLVSLLSEPSTSAPGPLYPVLYALLSPLTHLAAPAIRFENLTLLVLTLMATAWLLSTLGLRQPVSRAVMLMALPVFWVTGGLALTEIPALLMATVSVALLAPYAMPSWQQRQRGRDTVRIITSGLFCGLAIAGRQTHLPLLLMFALLLWHRPLRPAALVGFALALVLVLPIFIIWGGLVPKTLSSIGGGIFFENGFRALTYLAVYTIFLAPAFFRPILKKTPVVAGIAIAVVALNVLVFQYETRPFHRLVFEKLDPATGHLLGMMVGSVFPVFAVLLIMAFVMRLLELRHDRIFVLSSAFTILLLGTTFAISHAASRYVIVVFPFALVALQPFFVPSRWAALRLLGGSALGVTALLGYYLASPT